MFTVVTLPVEIDASMRAKKAPESGRIISGEEARGVRQVLDRGSCNIFGGCRNIGLATALLGFAGWIARRAKGIKS